MFAPAILPFQMTVVFALILAASAVIFLPRYGYARRTVMLFSCIASVALFIPSCMGIGLLVDLVRYGTFHYKTAAEISDRHIRLPASATNITVFKFASGHDARFTVSKDDLMQWIESHRENKSLIFGKSLGNCRYSTHGWTTYEDLEQYAGPHAPNGAGFSVWYSQKHGIAYVCAGYW